MFFRLFLLWNQTKQTFLLNYIVFFTFFLTFASFKWKL